MQNKEEIKAKLTKRFNDESDKTLRRVVDYAIRARENQDCVSFYFKQLNTKVVVTKADNATNSGTHYDIAVSSANKCEPGWLEVSFGKDVVYYTESTDIKLQNDGIMRIDRKDKSFRFDFQFNLSIDEKVKRFLTINYADENIGFVDYVAQGLNPAIYPQLLFDENLPRMNMSCGQICKYMENNWANDPALKNTMSRMDCFNLRLFALAKAFPHVSQLLDDERSRNALIQVTQTSKNFYELSTILNPGNDIETVLGIAPKYHDYFRKFKGYVLGRDLKNNISMIRHLECLVPNLSGKDLINMADILESESQTIHESWIPFFETLIDNGYTINELHDYCLKAAEKEITKRRNILSQLYTVSCSEAAFTGNSAKVFPEYIYIEERRHGKRVDEAMAVYRETKAYPEMDAFAKRTKHLEENTVDYTIKSISEEILGAVAIDFTYREKPNPRYAMVQNCYKGENYMFLEKKSKAYIIIHLRGRTILDFVEKPSKAQTANIVTWANNHNLAFANDCNI